MEPRTTRFEGRRCWFLAFVLSYIGASAWALPACQAQTNEGQEPLPSFGVTVVAPFGFCGRIFEIPENRQSAPLPLPRPEQTRPGNGPGGGASAGPATIGYGNGCSVRLPRFQELQPIGKIYTRDLNVPPRDFREGFPGVTDRFEWFAIEYTTRFWVKTPGKYTFKLLSDDGSALYIDERRIIDNDCMHPPLSATKSVRLAGGIHDLRVGYFQGPRLSVALVLHVKPPDGDWRVFNTDDFRPPPDPSEWKYPNPSNLEAPLDPCKAARRSGKLIVRP
ncbi:MAG TPA: PA14 domain-containing protein [Bryobacteraceae bacterium]|nr:PA14 domain-containing protein [Bryobacteraceae bacterium]